MSDKDQNNLEENPADEAVENAAETEEPIKEMNPDEAKSSTVTSSEMIELDDWVISDEMDEILELPEVEPQETGEFKGSVAVEDEAEIKEESKETLDIGEEKSPIFKELAEPTLPELPKENRARLQMQSPTRLYFYWSVRNNPFQTLNRAFGGKTGSYTFVTRLINKTDKTEELFKVETEGNWWFNVDADSDYLAELGFYAPNRPFIRVMFSNEVRTPRKNPSKRRDYTPSFNVNASQFAEVLDVAGYQGDALEVAFAGDDEVLADEATHKTYSQLVGKNTEHLSKGDGDEMRFVLLALAAGYSLEEIRGEIDPSLYDSLNSEISELDSENVLSALKENFDVFTDEIFEEEDIGDAIVGASLVNFPKRINKRYVPQTLSPKITDKDLAKLRKFSSISSGEFPINASNSN